MFWNFLLGTVLCFTLMYLRFQIAGLHTLLPTLQLKFMYDCNLNFITRTPQKELDQIQKSLTHYRILSLICKNFDKLYSSTIIPVLKYAPAIAGMLCFYIAVRFNLPLPVLNYGFLMVSIFGFGTSVIITNILSSIWSISGKYLARIQLNIAIASECRPKAKIALRKELRSLKPLRISVGGIYQMDRKAKVTFMKFLVDGTVQLLLSSE